MGNVIKSCLRIKQGTYAGCFIRKSKSTFAITRTETVKRIIF